MGATIEPIAVLTALSYREVQQACKSLGVGARGTKEELVARLLEHNWQPGTEVASHKAQPIVPAPGKTPVADKTPATSKRMAAAVAVTAAATTAALEEAAPPATTAVQEAAALPANAADPTPRRSSRKLQATAATEQVPTKALVLEQLVQATATPVPKSPPQDEEEVPQPLPAVVVRRPQQELQRAPLSKPRGSPLGRLLLLAALCASLTSLAVPACHSLSCSTLLRQQLPGPMQYAEQLAARLALGAQAAGTVPGAVTATALQRLVQGQALLQEHLEGARLWAASYWGAAQQWATAKLQRSEAQPSDPQPEPPSCRLNPAVLDNIVPATPAWAGLKKRVAAMLDGQRTNPSKAASTLFPCADSSCPAINHWLAWAAHQGCMLKLEASELGEDPSALRTTLATFLAQQPSGTVLIANAHQLSPSLVPLLSRLLWGHGSLRTGGATLLLSWEVPREVLQAESDGELRARVEAQAGLQALVPLIDYVLPTIH